MVDDDKYSNNEIYQMLKSLTSKVDEGFKGIHSRQDLTNGKVQENSEFRVATQANLRLLKWLIGLFGGLTIINIIVTVILKIDKLVL